jgi:thioredoxin-related protein
VRLLSAATTVLRAGVELPCPAVRAGHADVGHGAAPLKKFLNQPEARARDWPKSLPRASGWYENRFYRSFKDEDQSMTFTKFPSRAAMLCAFWIALAGAPLRAQSVSWYSDYNAARREAQDKNRPLVIDFSTQECHWCRMLETTTFRDPAVVKTLSERFVALHLDGEKEASLAQRLNITGYPTLIFADADGNILQRQDGYVKPAEFGKMLDHVLASAKPVDTAVVQAVHRTAPPVDDGANAGRARSAGQLLSLAQADYREQRFLACLERCKALKADYGDLPEASEAIQLETKIRRDPEELRLACDKMTDRLGEMYLDLADAFSAKDQQARAVLCLEWVVQACPGTPQAETAKEKLERIKKTGAR